MAFETQTTDDFFHPRGIDSTQQCITQKDIAYGNYILPFGASVSALCYIYLLWMYFIIKNPVLKRHPTTLAIYKCMFEFTFTQQYFWLPFLDVNMLYSNFTDNPPYNCDATKLAAVFSFITQAAMLGSELIFLTITIDLRMAYTNPFSSYKQNKYYFAMFVVGISISTGIALILMGNSVYGLSVEGSVWIQDRRAENGVSINWPKTVLYYIFILSIYAYCLWAYYVFHKSIRKGFGKTLSNRIPIMERSKKYTLGYIVYGGTILILEFITFLSSNSTPVALKSLPAYFYSFQGVWSLLVISYSNWDEITLENLNPFRFNEADHLVADVAEEGLLLQPHLNSALRAEVLYFSTQGIMHASTEYSRHVRAIDSESQRPSNSNDAHFPENIEDADERYDSRIYSFDDRVGGAFREDFSAAGISRRISNPMHIQSTINRRKSKENNQTRESTTEMVARPSVTGNGSTTNRMSLVVKTIAELERLNEEQTKAIMKEREEAFDEELENMGYSSNRSSIRLSITNSKNSGNFSIPFVGESVRPLSANSVRFSERPTVSNAIRTSVRKVPPVFLLNKANGELGAVGASHCKDQPISISEAGHKSLHDSEPYKVKTRSLEAELVALRTTSLTQSQSADDNSVDNMSDSTSTTVKWRDTKDAEFCFQHEELESDQVNLETFSWHLVESSNSSVTSSHKKDEEGQLSSRSSNTFAQSLNRLFSDAAEVVKSVLPSSYSDFRFKDFCPKLFIQVRNLCGINGEHYAKSFETTCRERFSEGRSGAFMYYSSDQKCIVKTTSKQELQTLIRIMPSYLNYLSKNPDTLLVKFLGAHCITMYGREIYFLVMLNVFPNFKMSERYDLKGSWVKRHGFNMRSTMDRFKKESADPPLYLDNDLQHKISLHSHIVSSLASQIVRDIAFLRDMNLMDYSLLIGVRREKFEVVEESLRKSTMSNSYVKESMSKKSQSCTFADSSVRASSDADKYSVIEKCNVDEENSNNQSLSSMGTGARFEGSTSNQSTNAQDLPESIQVDMFGRDPDGGMHAKLVEGPGTYYIGLIDVLQEWNYKKKLERIFKIYIRGENRDGLSAISPIKYANRFLQRAVLDVFDGLDESEKMLSRQISVNSVATNQVMLGLKNNLNGVGSDSLMQRPDSLSASIHSEATVGEEGIKYVRRIDSAREQ